MKKVIFLVAALMVIGVADVWASGCPAGYKLKKIGSVATSSNTTLTTAGSNVRLISVDASGSAATVALYDSNGTGGTASTDVVIEVGAAANTTALIPESGFFETPLSFTDGIHLIGTNFDAVSVYDCRP